VSILVALHMEDRRRARGNPLVWAGMVAGVVALYLLVRAFRRAAWERWNHLLAGIWLFYAQGTLLLMSDRAVSFEWPELGAWILLFSLSALIPVFAWSLWPRRA
jgi:hypothetical protein